MIKKICLAILVLFCSCKQNKTEQIEIAKIDSTPKDHYTSEENIEIDYTKSTITNWFKTFKTDTIIASEMYWKKIIEKDSLIKIFKTDFIKSPPLKDKTVIFLRDGKNGKSLIDQNYCKTISEPERAALGYIAMFYGTADSYFDKKTDEQCTIRDALNLDNKCTEKFNLYMKFYFRKDPKSVEEINNNCSTSSLFMGQSVYFYYSKIKLNIKGNKIYIDFKAEGFNRDVWDCNWTGKLTFLVDDDTIKLIEKKESEEEYVYHFQNCSNVSPPEGYIDNGKGEYRLPKKTKKK